MIVMKGFLPWAVPEVRPKTVAALFVRESDPAGSPIALAATMMSPPTSDFLNGEPVDLWARDNLSVGGGADYGVVVALSTRAYQDSDFAGKSLAAACGMTAVVCYTGTDADVRARLHHRPAQEHGLRRNARWTRDTRGHRARELAGL